MNSSVASEIPHLVPSEVEVPQSRDPDFVSALSWLSRGSDEPALSVVGIPFAGGSISRGRMDLAPGAVRRGLSRFSLWSEDHKVDLSNVGVVDLGDLEPQGTVEATQARVEETVAAICRGNSAPIVAIGGDNSITVGMARGVGADGLLTLDAHHDCRDPAQGATNGTPVRQLIEGGLSKVFQIGIGEHANSRANSEWAKENGVKWVTARDLRGRNVGDPLNEAFGAVLGECNRIWVDIDIDVLDRAFAPGAPASMPGGLTPQDLIQAAFILGSSRKVLGIDIVEVDPNADVAEVTVRTACAVLLAFASGVAKR